MWFLLFYFHNKKLIKHIDKISDTIIVIFGAFALLFQCLQHERCKLLETKTKQSRTLKTFEF